MRKSFARVCGFKPRLLAVLACFFFGDAGATDNVCALAQLLIVQSETSNPGHLDEIVREMVKQNAELASVVQRGEFQEALWELDRRGLKREYQLLRSALERELAFGQIVSSRMLSASTTGARLVTFESGVQAVLKSVTTQADLAYLKMDELFGTRVSPLVVRRESPQGGIEIVSLVAPSFVSAQSANVKVANWKIQLLDYLCSSHDRGNTNFLVRESDGLQLAIDNTDSFQDAERPPLLGFQVRAIIPNAEVLSLVESVGEEQIRSALSGVIAQSQIEQVIARRKILIRRARANIIGNPK